MHEKAKVFETHYQDYCRRIGQSDLRAASEILGIEPEGDGVRIRFLNRTYRVSGEGISNGSGSRPAYGLCVILAKYILCCPERIYHDPEWVAFRDFKKDAAVTNVNFFTSDVEHVLLKHFQGRVDRLEKACGHLGGVPHDTGARYDVSMSIDLLPRIRLLVLFNDRDEDFPALCRVLFQKHSEYYLDPESLAMTGAGLAKELIRADKAI
ncbi:MAG: DUF3786 domain-containing protein [Deltaproteobacteria bacterium]|nr:DUF3786 domain-containing protein [Deltaproteobacteria bacterium]